MNGFLTYVAKRFAQFLFVVFTGVTLAFLIAHLSPIDPIEQTVSLLTSFGATDPRAVEVLRESLRVLYGADGSLLRAVPRLLGPGPHRRLRPLALGLSDAGDDDHPQRAAVDGGPPDHSRRSSPGSSAIRSARSPATSAPTRVLKVLGLGVMALQPIPTYIVGLTDGDPPRLPLAGVPDQRRRADESRARLQLGLHLERPDARRPAGADARARRHGRLVHLDALDGLQHRHRRPRGLCRARRRALAHDVLPIRRAQRHAAAAHRPRAQPRARLLAAR